MAALHHRARRGLMSRPRLRGIVVGVAYVAGALALLLALDGNWPAVAIAASVVGVAGWFAAVWFGPHTADGYFMHVKGIWEAWVTEVRYATRQYRKQRDKSIDQFAAGLSSSEAPHEHARIVALLRTLQSGDDRDDPDQLIERVRALAEISRLADSAGSGGEYIAGVRQLQRNLTQALTAHDNAVEAAGRRAHSKLARSWRPREAETEHQELLRCLDEYSARLHELNVAVVAHDEVAAATTASELKALGPQLANAWEATGHAVHVHERWPMPEQPSA